MPKTILQLLSTTKSSSSFGKINPIIIANQIEVQINAFVIQPKSVEYWLGTVSSSDLPITILSTPAASPNMKRPKQIVYKF